MEIPLLQDLLIIFGLSLAVVIVCHRLRIPTIVGLLLTGVLAGPYGLGVVSAPHEVEVLAEIGVILLLFTIGLEFSIGTLLQIRYPAVVGGIVQLVATIAAGAGIGLLTGRPAGQCVFFGFLLALSSTAVVLKILQNRAEIDSPHGRTVLGMLIFQDVAVVLLMLLTPLLAGAGGNLYRELALLFGKGLVVAVLAVVLAKWIVPRLFYHVAASRDRELFLMAVIFTGLVVAWLTYLAGLSLALGAFFAGLIISESEYGTRALSDVLPMRDVFTSIFFVSIGMLLDGRFLLENPWLLVGLAGATIAVKALLAGGTVLAIGMPIRVAVISGLALAQVGEFSFILSRTGVEYGLMAGNVYQVFLGVAILTMIATPFLIGVAPRAGELAAGAPLPAFVINGFRKMGDAEEAGPGLSDHVIIVGFGPGGRRLAQAADASGIKWAAIELNPHTVKKEREQGVPVYYGDATREAALSRLGIDKARILVAGIPDPAATRRVVQNAKAMNKNLHVIARTPFWAEMEPLYKLGADEVIPAEFETSIEIVSRVLARYHVPGREIERFTRQVREDGYRIFREPAEEVREVCDLRRYIPEMEISVFEVGKSSAADGRSLSELDLRRGYGVTLLAVKRGDAVIPNPGADERFVAGDSAVILGRPENLSRAAELFSAAESVE